MIPSLALSESIRAALIADPTVARHISPERIRMAAVRPEQFPAIHLSPTRAEILGRASGGQIVAQISQIVSIWAMQDGSGTVESVAAAATLALLDAPKAEDFAFDAWDKPALVWTDTPGLEGVAHAAISLRAIIRWHE